MSAEPRPEGLTAAERDALMHHIGGWKFERQGLAAAEDAFMAEVARIVAAREAAARREALLERDVEREYGDAARESNDRLIAKVARVAALAEASDTAALTFADNEPNTAEWHRFFARSIRAALAEPERAEEER